MPEMYQMYRDIFFDGGDDVSDPNYEIREVEFKKKLEYAETPLFPECTNYTVMSAIVALYKHKATTNLSDTGFDGLLQMIGDMLPENNKLPKSYYETKFFLKTFDLGYEKIDACKNDCCLFRKENKHMTKCPKCGASRWKENERTKKVKNGVPAKVLRSGDRKMRHPVDTPAWHTIDKKWPSFASDSRNLRLGLSTDGFNPFGDLSSAYSCWPVTLVVYNLSPLELMSKENMMLTLLIPGPRQPGNDIDVYLEPLIDDLKELWEKGVEIYDAFAKSTFNLKVILMWTISDFPAFSNLSGHVTKGKKACPTCSDDTCSRRLNCSTKTVYLGHRRWLSLTHPFRKKKSWFDGSEEHRWKPKILSGTETLHAVKKIKNDWGKKVKGKLHIKPKIGKRKQKTKKDENVAWKKKSIFFELPYWEVLLVHHNLDVMHIEKNVCESIIGTLLNI
ncbi:uncharacterized protein LOC132281119 [Cornus florida]|uniref:uncharacterized protein LOC132281119 n=1 Tax=Cornus florida TaxID=4283 RepID=UPI0028A144C1|nr:uncharacterized protein LOC132281119 [Cornus florida]